MRVLDLFAGLESGTRPFADRGHEVVTTDIHAVFKTTVPGDLLDDDIVGTVLALGPYDFVWASPPCQGFSVMNIGRNWYHDGTPKTDTARMGLRLVERALEVIDLIRPQAFIIENPRAKLRKLPAVSGLERRTVTLCQYGMPYMKPTDLWGGFPPGLVLRPMCKNGDPCHVSAPRGSRTGSQGTLRSMQTFKDGTPEATAAYRRIPYDLAMDICVAAEAAIDGHPLQGATLFDSVPEVQTVCDACGQCYDHDPLDCGQPKCIEGTS